MMASREVRAHAFLGHAVGDGWGDAVLVSGAEDPQRDVGDPADLGGLLPGERGTVIETLVTGYEGRLPSRAASPGAHPVRQEPIGLAHAVVTVDGSVSKAGPPWKAVCGAKVHSVTGERWTPGRGLRGGPWCSRCRKVVPDR